MRARLRSEGLLEDRAGTPFKLFLHPSPGFRDFPSCPDLLSSLRWFVEPSSGQGLKKLLCRLPGLCRIMAYRLQVSHRAAVKDSF